MDALQNSKYFTTEKQLLKIFDKYSRRYAFGAKDISSYKTWKEELRNILMNITGISKMEKSSLQPQTIESRNMDGYRRDKVIIQTEDDVWMPFYILIPQGIQKGEKRACIIAAHGHGSCGKYAIAGDDSNPVINESVGRWNADYGLKLVQEGYIVFCPDARGTGERREWMHQGDEKEKMLACSCNQLNNAAISLGLSLTGMWVWDLMRLIDYIESYKLCDSNRIGCCGFSGGGLQTIWLAALDERIRCAVVSGYFHGYKDTLLRTNQCGCNFIPHLWEYIDMGDLGALIAPKALLIERGCEDPLSGERGLSNVTEQLEITRDAYRLLGEESKLDQHVFRGGHRWDGEKTYDFLKKWLLEHIS